MPEVFVSVNICQKQQKIKKKISNNVSLEYVKTKTILTYKIMTLPK